jgi:hypothetical protein
MPAADLELDAKDLLRLRGRSARYTWKPNDFALERRLSLDPGYRAKVEARMFELGEEARAEERKKAAAAAELYSTEQNEKRFDKFNLQFAPHALLLQKLEEEVRANPTEVTTEQLMALERADGGVNGDKYRKKNIVRRLLAEELGKIVEAREKAAKKGAGKRAVGIKNSTHGIRCVGAGDRNFFLGRIWVEAEKIYKQHEKFLQDRRVLERFKVLNAQGMRRKQQLQESVRRLESFQKPEKCAAKLRLFCMTEWHKLQKRVKEALDKIRDVSLQRVYLEGVRQGLPFRDFGKCGPELGTKLAYSSAFLMDSMTGGTGFVNLANPIFLGGMRAVLTDFTARLRTFQPTFAYDKVVVLNNATNPYDRLPEDDEIEIIPDEQAEEVSTSKRKCVNLYRDMHAFGGSTFHFPRCQTQGTPLWMRTKSLSCAPGWSTDVPLFLLLSRNTFKIPLCRLRPPVAEKRSVYSSLGEVGKHLICCFFSKLNVTESPGTLDRAAGGKAGQRDLRGRGGPPHDAQGQGGLGADQGFREDRAAPEPGPKTQPLPLRGPPR